MKGFESVYNPEEAIRESLRKPIGTDSFSSIVRHKLEDEPEGDAVISDNTRPVPYKGEQGILMTLIRELLNAGVKAEKITVLCANGTHVPLRDKVFRTMIDPEVYKLGIKVINHDCQDENNLKFLG